MCFRWSSKDFKYMTMSSMYTSMKVHKNGDRVPCMACWNSGGLFHHLNGIHLKWWRPLCMHTTVIALDCSSNSSWVNPNRALNTEQYWAPDKACRMSVCYGIRCWFAIVALFSLWKLMQARGLLLRYTTMTGAPQGLQLSLMTPWNSQRSICLLMASRFAGEA